MNMVNSTPSRRAQALYLCLTLFISLALLAACSTMSFFPTATANKAADKVIDDIWPVPAVAPPVKSGVKDSVNVSAVPAK